MTHKRVYLAAVLCTYVACASEDDARASCDVEGVAFLTSFHQTSGNCGAVPPELTVFRRINDPGCSGSLSVAMDCAVTNSITCLTTEAGTVVERRNVSYVLRPTNGGDGLSGTIEVVYQNAEGKNCRSFYSAWLVRQ